MTYEQREKILKRFGADALDSPHERRRKEIINVVQTMHKRILLTFWVVLAIVLVPLLTYPVAYYLSADTVTLTVTYKERVEDRYLIYSDEGVYENTDSYIFLKFNSSKLYNDIKPGKQYTAKVAGWRVPFLSMYRNVIKVEQ